MQHLSHKKKNYKRKPTQGLKDSTKKKTLSVHVLIKAQCLHD